jgi:hypothetical protein
VPDLREDVQRQERHPQEQERPHAQQGAEQQRARRQDAVGYHARVQLARLGRGEKLRDRVAYPVTAWAFGRSPGLVFLPGKANPACCDPGPSRVDVVAADDVLKIFANE